VRVEQLAPCSPPAVVLRFDEVAPNMPVGRTVMVCDAQTRGRAVLEWHVDRLADVRRMSPLLCPPEPGLIEARGDCSKGRIFVLARANPGQFLKNGRAP
jgi:hypothetical protein